MTDAVRKLVEAAKELHRAVSAFLDTPANEDENMEFLVKRLENVRAAIPAVEADSAREEAASNDAKFERCQWCNGEGRETDSEGELVVCHVCEGKSAIQKQEAVEHAIARKALEAVENASKEGSMGDMMSACEGAMHNEIDRQLSLLCAHNFEVVEIPQGEGCSSCVFGDDEYDVCRNPSCPKEFVNELAYPDQPNPAWCRQRYGVEAKP